MLEYIPSPLRSGKQRLVSDSEHITFTAVSPLLQMKRSRIARGKSWKRKANCSGGLRPPKRLRRSESAATANDARGECRYLTQPPLHWKQLQPKTNIELAAVMGAATGETCDCAFDLAYAREISAAIRATVNETRRITLRRKRQRMTALFVCDSQIATSLLPLGSVR